MSTMHAADRLSARLKIVEEHIARENQHDLDGILRTFGKSARYDDKPWDGHYSGRDGVRTYYERLLRALPDLRIKVQRRYAGEDAIILEVIITGHHLGPWRGLLPTGRSIRFPLCGIFTFDEEDRLAGEKIYYDRASVLRQLGLFHEPSGILATAAIVLTHPLTIAQTIGRLIKRR
jgi:steroid delta-isomerase-like uncharacterized protein